MPTEAEIRERLAKRRVDIEQVLAAADRQSSNDNGQLPEEIASEDLADLATNIDQRTRDYSVVEMAEGALEEIEIALRNLDAGTYGICEVCGNAIAEERLEARPEARYCVEHAPHPETAVS
jgi:RNA polymerase-binding transcription factor DksA